jgi:putative hydrolase of the HAD superfamily
MQKYKHLFFDLDHTLWDFETNCKDSLSKIYAEQQLGELLSTSFEVFFKQYLYHNELLWSKYNAGKIKADELKWKRMYFALLDFQIGNENLAKELSSHFLDLLPTRDKLFPYTVEILTYLKQKNYQLHLITNGFKEVQHNKLKYSNLTHFFTHIITSEESNSVKPNEAIFEYALKTANAALKESIMLGDNLDADISGAINAGMDSVFVNHINASTNLQPTYMVTHLKELEDIF